MNVRALTRYLTLLSAMLFAVPALVAQQGSAIDIGLNDVLPKDPSVRTGVLPNGISYYIRQNDKPEQRAELRLAVNAGSSLEDDSQLGLAHFVEHMAFNGTEHFAKNDLVAFLESIGMRFGADLNAYTSFDETVYMLQLPTDDHAVLEKGLLILADWANGVSFEGEEIDAERGVVIEEWRARRSGDSRVQEDHFKIMFQGSRYADRMPIGTKQNLETFDHETLRRYYKTWYRPDLMAVVAVGDFDPEDMERMIKKQFSSIPAVKEPKAERPEFDIPKLPGTRYSISGDPEASSPSVGLFILHDKVSRTHVSDYRSRLIEGMVSMMLNQRLNEIRQQADPPFIFAGSNAGLTFANHLTFSVNARVADGEYLRGFRSILEEVERVKRHGFTATELDRAKNAMLRSIDQTYAERDKAESRNYAREYVGNFTSDEAFPGIEYEHTLYNTFVPGVTLEEVNRKARELISEDGRVVTVGGPEHEDAPLPMESDLQNVVAEVAASDIEPYSEGDALTTLMDRKPTPGSIVATRKLENLGVTEWTLSNGARVILRPTDFKNDEILMTGYSPGGTSLVSDQDYLAASTAASLMARGGLGEYDRIALDKFLSDKVANVGTGIDNLYETVGGSASNDDLETMFQLLYLNFTAPRKDETAMQSYLSQLRGFLDTRGSRPEQVFSDTVGWVSTGHHFRTRPLTIPMLDELSLDKSYRIYKERFANAGDFTFVFVGSFDPQTIKPMVERYIASLPSTKVKESWKDVGIETPEGNLRKVVRKGLEEKSIVRLVYNGDFDWSMENRHALQSMIEVFRMKLRESLREDKGGVYSPGVGGSYEQYPQSEYQITVSFSCDPHRVDELIGAVEDIVNSMKSKNVDQDYIEKVKEIQKRQRETGLQENSFWLGSLEFYYKNNEDPESLLEYGELYKGVTADMIREQAKTYFDEDNQMTFILMPEK